MTKFETTYTIVKKVADQLNVSLIEAASKMQATCAKCNNENMIAELHEFKVKVAGL